MESKNQNLKENFFSNGLCKEIKISFSKWAENVTALDLSNMKLSHIDLEVIFPPLLLNLNLAFNEMTVVPPEVLNLKHLTNLNISFNKILCFDEIPAFCNTIICLNIDGNNLEHLPYWIWTECPNNLRELHLSCNMKIAQSTNKHHVEKLLHYNSEVTDLYMCNCRLSECLRLFSTFSKVKTLVLGSLDTHRFNVNFLENVPFQGIDKCCDIEKLDLTNTQIYNVLSTIDMYSNLIEINLSQNYVHSLPDEFCNLVNLEICILSSNNILYLPDNFSKLQKLTKLYLANNVLCMLPEDLCLLPKLQLLDIYNNNIYDLPKDIKNIIEIDVAYNYFEEPDDSIYLQRKHQLRGDSSDRFDGKKTEVAKSESEYSTHLSFNDELILNNEIDDIEDQPQNSSSLSEDWDSDDYWVPHYYPQNTQPPHSPWLYFVRRKLEEGNFCPIDMHPVSVSEKVKYEKMCNPQEDHESDGQFDDFSEDDS